MLPKTGAYVNIHDGQTKWMYFLIKVDKLLEKYNTFWDRGSTDMKKDFDGKSAYNKNFLKTKIKSHGYEVADMKKKMMKKMKKRRILMMLVL